MSLLFFDTEFTGLRKDTTLISLGIVSEDGKKFYAEFTDYDEKQCDDFIKKNVIGNLTLEHENIVTTKNGDVFIRDNRKEIRRALLSWIRRDVVLQFVSDVCHYDFVLLIDLLTNGGTALDIPLNISAVCHDINSDIARHYGITEREAFDKSREEIISELCGHEIPGRKHNSLYDAEVIKTIWEEINAGGQGITRKSI